MRMITWLMRRRSNEVAFTLLEVMIALSILATGLTLLSHSQQASMRAVGYGRMMTIATMLARGKMIDIEEDLFREGFSDFEEEEKGDFDEEGFKQLRWIAKIEKVELPSSINAESLKASAEEASNNQDSADPLAGGIGQLNAGMMGQYLEMFRNLLDQSIRRVHLTVSWDEGKKERSISVVSFFTDASKIDSAGMMLQVGNAAAQQGGKGQGASSTSPGQKTNSATPSGGANGGGPR